LQLLDGLQAESEHGAVPASPPPDTTPAKA